MAHFELYRWRVYQSPVSRHPPPAQNEHHCDPKISDLLKKVDPKYHPNTFKN